MPGNVDVAAGGTLETGDAAQRRRLAATARSEQNRDATLLETLGNGPQDWLRAIRLLQSFQHYRHLPDSGGALPDLDQPVLVPQRRFDVERHHLDRRRIGHPLRRWRAFAQRVFARLL